MPIQEPPFPSPNVENYFIGKGIVYFKDVGDSDSAFTPIGNVPKFEFTPKPEIIKHYSSMAPTKVLELIGVKSKEAELAISVDELTPDNMLIALLGELNSAGQIEILEAPSIYRAVRLIGTNDFGAQMQWDLFNVFFDASKAIGLIDDNWGELPLTGLCLRLGDISTGSFGRVTFLGT